MKLINLTVFIAMAMLFVFQETSSNKIIFEIASSVSRPFLLGKLLKKKTTISFCKNMFFGTDKLFIDFANTKIAHKPTHKHVIPEILNDLSSISETQQDISKAMSKASRYLQLDDWEWIGQEDGVKVWRLKSTLTGDGSEWPCIKSTVTIDMKPEKLRELFMDSNKVHLLNKYSAGRVDIENIGTQSKIVWNKTKLPYAMKPYDFCSLMHCDVDPLSGHNLIVSQAVTRPSAPISNEFARSEILLGVNVLAPCGTNGSQTELTSISHVRLANLPVYFAKKSAFQGTVNYLGQLKAAVTKLNAS